MRSRTPKIKAINPLCGIEGGKVMIEGSGFEPDECTEYRISFGGSLAMPLMMSSSRIVTQIPENSQPGPVVVRFKTKSSNEHDFILGRKLTANVNPVDSPVFDSQGNLYVTYSGRRGEEVPVSIFRITPSGDVGPYLTNIPNPTSVAIDDGGNLYVSSRFEGTIYKATPSQDVSIFARDLGVPTGLAFHPDGTLYVGDRAGRILRVSPAGQASLFAEMPESTVAFHLSFDPDGNLLVSNPGLSSYNQIWLINPTGKVLPLYGGFGRPQGMAVDEEGNIYLCEAKAGDSGVLRISPDGTIHMHVAGPIVVGVAFDKNGSMAITSPGAVYLIPAHTSN